MRALSISIAVLMLALVTQTESVAQRPARVAAKVPLANMGSLQALTSYRPYVPNPHYYGHRSSTVAQGYARGLAALTYSRGQYNRLTAEGRLIHTYADSRDIENYDQGVRTYFEMRQYNRDARAEQRGPRATQADLVRIAAQNRPQRLSPSELSRAGAISWPLLLQADEFAAFRAEVEDTYARRAANGELALDERVKIDRTAKVMMEVLQVYIDGVPPMDYMAARRFIESLAHEARQPLS